MGRPLLQVHRRAHWLRDDLTHAIRALAPGESVVVDYAGEVPDAPSFVIEQSLDGEFTAETVARSWMWRGTDPMPLDLVVFSRLTRLRDVRGARGEILVPPQV